MPRFHWQETDIACPLPQRGKCGPIYWEERLLAVVMVHSGKIISRVSWLVMAVLASFAFSGCSETVDPADGVLVYPTDVILGTQEHVDLMGPGFAKSEGACTSLLPSRIQHRSPT
jgi:hypothetical protein